MKIYMYYKVRLIGSFNENEANEYKNRYFIQFGGDAVFRFRKKISLPSHPVRSQRYYLSFDPAYGVPFEQEVEECGGKEVVVSGFLEHGERISPFFGVAEVLVFSEEFFEEKNLGNKSEEEKKIAWNKHVATELKRLTSQFKEYGWEYTATV